ncbi:hypothetical protein BKA57DRAFT_159577 [Linnemannia elongata]|nr:hypothetical protein BKA57DRAFT_159577 [Linnemannia elongata]
MKTFVEEWGGGALLFMFCLCFEVEQNIKGVVRKERSGEEGNKGKEGKKRGGRILKSQLTRGKEGYGNESGTKFC